MSRVKEVRVPQVRKFRIFLSEKELVSLRALIGSGVDISTLANLELHSLEKELSNFVDTSGLEFKMAEFQQLAILR